MLNPDLTFLDAQNIISIKICLVLFLVFSLIALFSKKIKPWYFMLGSGLIMGLAYYFLSKNLAIPFWGLKGDELTISAMYTTFSQIGLGSDFSYHNLPPFYPPLFFWLTVILGKFLSLSAIGMAKLGGLLAFTFFPIALYLIQKLYWKNEDKIKNLEITLISAPFLIMLFVNVDEIFGKPYELFTSASALYWLMFFYLEVKKPNFSWLKIFIFGISGALIFMTYYLWIIFIVIALSLVGLTIKKEAQWRFFALCFSVLSLTIIFSLPFLFPLVSSYLKYGTENWQTGFFTIDNINWRTLFFEKLDWKNLLMFLGFASIVFNYKDDKAKPLIACLVTVYLWWFMGLVTLSFFKVPMQEFRGFSYFMPMILAIGLSFGLTQIWTILDSYKFGNRLKLVIAFSGILLFVNYSLMGSFLDDPIVRERLVESRILEERFQKLSAYLKTQTGDPITLNSIPELVAFVPINNFIYFNQHNSHPAANFSQRYEHVKDLARSKNADEFYKKSQTSPFGKIDRFILYRTGNRFPLFYHTDKMMTGIEENIYYLNDDLFSEKYFKLAYKFYDYEIWETK